mmetsp:Transcript_32017/g.63071  ORF Transcript_32017/g.63071 Transcript_32017/m.63071 type:complete len:261 (+) Transcript_32017:240-1022(+)
MTVQFIPGHDPVAIFKDEAGGTMFQEDIPNVGINPNSPDADENDDLIKWFGDRGFQVRPIENAYSPQPASLATFAGRRYELYKEANRREVALKHANGRGGRLLSVETPEEAAFLANNFLRELSPNSVWLAASDYGWEGNWKWESGPLAGQRFWTEEGVAVDGAFAPWNEGEPNNAHGFEEEDCAVIIWQAERNDVAFNDVACTKRHLLVIEFDETPTMDESPKVDEPLNGDETCKTEGTCNTDEALKTEETPRTRLNEEL